MIIINLGDGSSHSSEFDETSEELDSGLGDNPFANDGLVFLGNPPADDDSFKGD